MGKEIEMNSTTNTANAAENKMGIMPVRKLLVNMSLPMMCSMLVQAMYNVVDSVFVSHVSEDALTAVSLAFPIQSLIIAIGAGTGVGVNALVSRALGEKKRDEADKVALHGVFLSFLSYIAFLIVGLFLVKPFYATQTDSYVIASYGYDYLSVCCIFSIGIFTQFIFERLLQSTGRTFQTMITQTIGAVTNIILDPILIFGLFGFPRMEAKGAAVATVIGQCIAGILAIVFNFKYNDDLDFKFSKFRPCGYVIKNIYIIGVPSIIMQSIGSVMVLGLNKILMAFSSTAVAVFGVYFKLQSFVFMPVFGLNNGMIPIIAYNYGAKNKDRMIKTFTFALQIAVTIMVVGAIVMEMIPGVILNIFNASESMLSMGITALKIICIHFPIAAFCIVTGSLFQALGKATYSMINSIMRQLVVLLPVAYLLGLTGNVNNVWWAFPIAELASATVTSIFYIRIKKTIISKI